MAASRAHAAARSSSFSPGDENPDLAVRPGPPWVPRRPLLLLLREARAIDFLGLVVPALALADPVAELPLPRLRVVVHRLAQLADPVGDQLPLLLRDRHLRKALEHA